MGSFSKGQRRIARYILDNPDKAAAMTASRLGELAQVSESTVVRFASEVGCDGYPGLQRALQELLRSRLTAAQRFREADGQFSHKDLLGTVVRSDREKLRQLAAQADRTAFEDAVERVMKARHVYILGVRSSSFVAGYLHFYLHLLREHVTLVQSNAAGEIFEQLFRVGPEDVMIAISFPRYSRVTVNTVQFARDRGASIIAVTDNSLSPVYPFSDTALLAPCEMISFIDSMVAPLSLVNALLVALAHRMGTDASAVFSQLEDIWNEYGIFGRPEDE
ncbi:MAG: MurR/RpiR family transcriptional regulator [Oscillibacter sp.]|nr:MurR/RpiR family transcriptional regulator [Oscillibacter sp.]